MNEEKLKMPNHSTHYMKAAARDKRVANLATICAVLVFLPGWSVGMYLSYRGFTSPRPAIGAIFPLQIHGGTVYVCHWQYYLCSPEAFWFAFALMAFAFYLRRRIGGTGALDRI
jgi:hypothetical protein